MPSGIFGGGVCCSPLTLMENEVYNVTHLAKWSSGLNEMTDKMLSPVSAPVSAWYLMCCIQLFTIRLCAHNIMWHMTSGFWNWN